MHTPDQLRLAEPSHANVSNIRNVSGAVQWHFSLDHFGVIADPMLRTLMNPTTPKRERRVARNDMVRLLKSSKQIGKALYVHDVGMVVAQDGSLWITVIGTQEKSNEAPTAR